MRLKTKCLCTVEFEVESSDRNYCRDAYDQFLEDHSFCRQMARTLIENMEPGKETKSGEEAVQRIIRSDKERG